MTIVVTGAAGFIGSNFVKLLLTQTTQPVISFDALTYAGNLKNISTIHNSNHTFIKGNICSQTDINQLFENHSIHTIYHFAAESHVDRSIQSSDPFIQTNIVGTQRLLDAAKHHNVSKFIHISTDEVYGTLSTNDPAFTEQHPIAPNSPYSASKASSDLLVRSYVETFNFPAIITRCSNNYGPFQFPEKLIPLMIHNACNNQPLPVYGNGKNIRDWIHVQDHATGILAASNHGKIGEVYNIGGECELENIDIVKRIIKHTNASESLIQYVSDRPGHDFRYAINNTKIKNECGFEPSISFEDGLIQTIEWYKQHTEWLADIISGDYQHYYKEQYQ